MRAMAQHPFQENLEAQGYAGDHHGGPGQQWDEAAQQSIPAQW